MTIATKDAETISILFNTVLACRISQEITFSKPTFDVARYDLIINAETEAWSKLKAFGITASGDKDYPIPAEKITP